MIRYRVLGGVCKDTLLKRILSGNEEIARCKVLFCGIERITRCDKRKDLL